ncbi:hypothetical protein NM208_g5936 [Fusarium decemcellulare]|uniref:Uncharacterized protein n=1 Tax=Fusarium decemcellulare TaxID=57161 RepID=A0ACC1SF05_9HYPO|nr:hypothetical protein NM208_g5936 [Fusarium decemcellulare]
MSLNSPLALSRFVGGINLYAGTTPISVVFRDTLYLFYAGSGADGVWCTSTQDGRTWAQVYNLNNKGAQTLGIAQGTSPAVAVYNDTLYLFFNGAGGDATYVTTFNGLAWTPVSKYDRTNTASPFLPNTSPSVAVYRNRLYLFYCATVPQAPGSSQTVSGIVWDYYDGSQWNGQSRDGSNNYIADTQLQGAQVAAKTSPSVVVCNDALYVFFNGDGMDATYVGKLVGDSWVSMVPVLKKKGSLGTIFLPKTSPNALVLLDPYVIRLHWVDNATKAIFYSDYRPDGNSWTPRRKLSCNGNIPRLAADTNLNTVQFQGKSYAFWARTDAGINFAAGFVWQISTDWLRPVTSMGAHDSFTMTTGEDDLVSLLRETLGHGAETGTFATQYPVPQNDVSDFVRGASNVISDTIDAKTAIKYSITTSLVANSLLLSYLTVLELGTETATVRFYYVK